MEDCHIFVTLQATARGLLGTNTTAFTKITDGNTVVKQGELVSLAVKPATIGRIMYFSIAQVVPLSLLHFPTDSGAQDTSHEQKSPGCSADMKRIATSNDPAVVLLKNNDQHALRLEPCSSELHSTHDNARRLTQSSLGVEEGCSDTSTFLSNIWPALYGN